jgi:hypothetical protein
LSSDSATATDAQMPISNNENNTIVTALLILIAYLLLSLILHME